MKLRSSEPLFSARSQVRLGTAPLVGPPALRISVSELGPHDAELEVVLVDGRYACRRLTLTQRKNGPPVTPASLRQVVISQAIRVAVWGHLKVVEELPGMQALTPLGTMPPDVASAGPTEDAIRWLAYIYTWAYAVGLSPTKTVMDVMKLSRGTAARWLAMARDAGLLAPTTERRAGA